MELKLKLTNDGSHTLYRTDLDETYHSTHGAIQESKHVFIKKGLDYSCSDLGKKKISILEVGFGTGLNCFLSFLYAKKNNIFIEYTALEINPLCNQIVKELNYCTNQDEQCIFNKMHSVNWNELNGISSDFKLNKIHNSLQEYTFKNTFDLVYFDAFGPRVEPNLWKKEWYEKIKTSLNNNAIIVTYCAKGAVRRDLISAGYIIERLEGPPGKREMLRGSI
jgi:tRNA U34 5-methylaminomethyl-2-thiouridine-forming methyltransferase MnmC